MDVQVVRQPIENLETEALVAIVFEKENPFGPRLQQALPVRRFLHALVESGEITGKLYETSVFFRPLGLVSKRLLVVGGGKQEKFGAFELRRAAGVAVRSLKSKGLAEIAFVPDGALPDMEAAAASVEGAVAADFEPGRYKTEGANEKHIGRLRVVLPATADDARSREALERARVTAESQNFARELINEPGNRLTPSMLAERARAMAAEVGLECEVLGRPRLEELKMGAFLGVAQGSEEPPALIVLRHSPPNAPTGGRLLGLIGKGITFDSGGISIKPSDNMDKMKYDMAGGATMLGVMRALALLRSPVPALAVVPATENLPSGRAQKPGDVRIAMSGKSIEIINTDAEGRLVLADALHYARTLGCTHLVDAATLTGAIAVALGAVNVGVFGNDQKFLELLWQSARAAGEKMWPMPLDDEYKDQIRGTVADILNTGGRYGGAVTAAMFLKEFVGDTPWIHLDIAGTAWLDDAKPYQAKGASGIAVRTLVNLALGFPACAR